MSEKVKVRGYMKPAASFHTLVEWDIVVAQLLELQHEGIDTRGGIVQDQRLIDILNNFFGYQLIDEVARWDLLTQKNVLDFIEDFVNHRFWSFEREYSHYFPDINRLKFAYFYSRGDMEPYVMLDDEYTIQLYGSTYNPKLLCHYTTEEGAKRLSDAISRGIEYDISSFTVMDRPFFRKESNVLVTFIGNVRAGFRSDIKSMALDTGRRACNMYRLEYPGRDINNICYELDTCDSDVRTSLWNEYIATPIEIVGISSR
tara:strand:+ start:5353 stop:6126 length:774 start_codon:yes stop_codon:yes gene_type:complete